MCDRKQNEVLARELAIQYWNGKKNQLQIPDDMKIVKFVETNWKQWEDIADTILNNLEYHSKK